MSETSAARSVLAPFCQEKHGLDMGFGGDSIVPHAITFDMPKPYTNVGGDKQIMRGDCRNLGMFCDGAMDWIYSSHLIEDWKYRDIEMILTEWRRVLKPGGLLVTNCPDQQKFLSHCARTGQPLNMAHANADFSLANFIDKCLAPTGPWETVFVEPEAGPYSFYIVVRKV